MIMKNIFENNISIDDAYEELSSNSIYKDIFDDISDERNKKIIHKKKSFIAALNKERLTNEELDELFVC